MTIQRTPPAELQHASRAYTVMPRDSMDLILTMAEGCAGDALAIWAYLLSKPERWVVRKANIMDALGVGRVRYDAAMTLLHRAGLVYLVADQDERGHMLGRRLVVTDTPKVTESSITAQAVDNTGKSCVYPVDNSERICGYPVDNKQSTEIDGTAEYGGNVALSNNRVFINNTLKGGSKKSGPPQPQAWQGFAEPPDPDNWPAKQELERREREKNG